MKKLAIVMTALCLGGCLSDADTASNRSVLPSSTPTARTGKDATDLDSPRQLCESTEEGGEAKTVCY